VFAESHLIFRGLGYSREKDLDNMDQENRQTLEQEASFRGLLYEPTLEHEVVILFSLLINHIKDNFAIEEYPDTFPDCLARRNGQRIGIEFEVLASHFYEHKHHEDENLNKCNLIICWKNDIRRKTTTRNGVELLTFDGHDIEIMALDEVIRSLQEVKSLNLILHGRRPDIDRANKERFFEQLKESVNEEKYGWIEELYEQTRQREEFEVRWGGGERWSTMRFYVRKWDVDPIDIGGDGSVYVSYQGNPAISPWELPQEVQTALRQLFKHHKQKWPSAPLKTRADLNNIKKAVGILAEHSKRSDVIWHD